MAGRTKRTLDLLRPSRRDVEFEAVATKTFLAGELQNAQNSADTFNDQAAALLLELDVSHPESKDATNEYKAQVAKAVEQVRPAAAAYMKTVKENMDRVSAAQSMETSWTMENTLRLVELSMSEARQDFNGAWRSAQALVKTAAKTLTDRVARVARTAKQATALRDTPRRPKLGGPAKDTLRGRHAAHQRKASADRRGGARR
ncbi:hypothetical protein DFP74_1818 [Nocardiopsis sp. Huas11]|uniref:hypothetical protein n=1 Tax=Nocardiopsis sp. Huas11 TaxID=2183912 RepID=UPI000EB04220|nr:hypothetical protein [Nocardiopsis sp. Huas11]RKS06194.1 hypothetical protein DFP74_1818 [Nocardiopsis sp. Huas11]